MRRIRVPGKDTKCGQAHNNCLMSIRFTLLVYHRKIDDHLAVIHSFNKSLRIPLCSGNDINKRICSSRLNLLSSFFFLPNISSLEFEFIFSLGWKYKYQTPGWYIPCLTKCLIIKAAWNESSVCSTWLANFTKWFINGSSINAAIGAVAPSNSRRKDLIRN